MNLNAIRLTDVPVKGAYFVYTLRCVSSEVPFYVGITNRKENRLDEHFYSARRGDSQMVYTKLRNCGENKETIVYEIIGSYSSAEIAKETEKFLIASYGRQDVKSGILKNQTDGGEGVFGRVLTEGQKRRLSDWRKGKAFNTGVKRPDAADRLSKPVSMFGADGKLIKTFPSLVSASKSLGICHSSISRLVTGKSESRWMLVPGLESGVTFRYFEAGVTALVNEDFKLPSNTARRVRQLTLSGDFIKEYPSIREAAKDVGVDPGSISSSIRGRSKSSAGFLWETA